VAKREENIERSKKNQVMEGEIEEDRSARNMDQGQLNKKKNTPMDSLEHLVGKKERHAGESLKTRIKLTKGFRHLGF
jgi:hypothetical protein